MAPGERPKRTLPASLCSPTPKEGTIMSRRPFSLALRTALFAGLFAFTSLSRPNAAHAQTTSADRALLNKTDAPFGASVASAPGVIDGMRALLSRPAAGDPQVFQPAGTIPSSLADAHPGEGERALLARWPKPKAAHVISAGEN